MAAPVYQSTGTYSQTSGGSPATSIIVSAPASIAAGDLLQLHLTLDNASATINSVPSGWTQAGGSPVIINTGGNQQNVVYYKWATGSEPANYTFGFSASTFAEGAIMRITGSVGSGSPYDGTPATATNPSSGSTSTPVVSLTTTGPDRLITHAYTKVNSGAFTPNAGYTTRVSGGFNTCGASTVTQTSAGSTGTVQATKATTDQSTAWLGAILPPATGTAESGTARVALGGTGTARKVAVQQGRAAVGLRGGGAAAKTTPTAGRAALAPSGTGAARKVGPATGRALLVAAGLGAARKTATGTGQTRAAVAGAATQRKTALAGGRDVLALAATGSEVKRVPLTGRVGLLLAASGVVLPTGARLQTGRAALVLAARMPPQCVAFRPFTGTASRGAAGTVTRPFTGVVEHCACCT